MKQWLLMFGLFATQAYALTNHEAFKINSKEEHQITLLNHGISALEARIQMIEEAKESIDVEYFIFNVDRAGKIISQALIKKAEQGVKVRILLDYFMVKSQFSPFYAFEMAKHGIEVRYFNPTASLNLLSGQYRNHRKVLIIDGKAVITGGRNIADEYFDFRKDFNFLDRDIKIEGEIVRSIQSTFETVWNSKYSLKVARERKPEYDDIKYRGSFSSHDDFLYRADLRFWNNKVKKASDFLSQEDEKFLEIVRAKGKLEIQNEYQGTCQNMSFNSEYPNTGEDSRPERIIKYDISERFSNAKESIFFDSPYFIVDDNSKNALETALSNNVKVTLLTNSLHSTDAIFVYAVFNNIIKKWVKKGLDAHIFRGEIPQSYQGFNEDSSKTRYGIHAKSFVFDHKDVVIGTYNFDPRSANINAEMTIACEDNPELALRVTNDIQDKLNGSIHLKSNKIIENVEFYKTGFLKRLQYIFITIPSNMFDYLL
jgi:putative cardiolipin synthase